MLSRFRLPSAVHVVRSDEVFSHYDVEMMRDIVKLPVPVREGLRLG